MKDLFFNILYILFWVGIAKLLKNSLGYTPQEIQFALLIFILAHISSIERKLKNE